MTKHFCDKCNCELDTRYHFSYLFSTECFRDESKRINYELCKDCNKTVEKAIGEAFSNSPLP